MRTILYTLLAICLATSSIAQKAQNSLIKQANIEFSEMRYAYAIPLYKRIIELNAKDVNAFFKLSKCYQINNQYDSAIKYTQLAVEMGASIDNMLPELLANKGDYMNALAAYSKVNSPITSIRQKGFTNLEAYSKSELNYTIHYLAINTAFNELAPISFKNGLVFESNRSEKINGKNEFSWDGTSYSRLYFTANKDTIPQDSAAKLIWVEKPFKMAIPDLAKETVNDANKIFTKKFNFKKIPYQKNDIVYFDEAFNSKLNVGAICFSIDSNTAYFTRNQTVNQGWNKNNKIDSHLLEIWSTSKVDGKFSNFMKLPFNNINASYFHPALSKNGKRLYFISDQEGGKGGADLYYVDKDTEGNWGSPINAGDNVNTAGNELFPTIADSVLYISSNGHEGLGGLDIYKVTLSKATRANKKFFLKGIIKDANSKKAISAVINLIDLADQSSFTKIEVDSSGQFIFALPYIDSVGISITSSFHEDANTTITSASFDKDNISTQEFYLSAIKKQFTQTFKNVLFATDAATLLPGSEKELNELVAYLIAQPTATILIEGHTDNTGDANKNKILSLSRAKSIAQFLMEHKIQAQRITTIGYGDTKPIASNDTEQGRQQNRRTSFTISIPK